MAVNVYINLNSTTKPHEHKDGTTIQVTNGHLFVGADGARIIAAYAPEKWARAEVAE